MTIPKTEPTAIVLRSAGRNPGEAPVEPMARRLPRKEHRAVAWQDNCEVLKTK